jgi:hypothetical protein
MATKKDVLTSSVYFGLYGGQLEEDVQEKVASNLNRALDAFDIRNALEKIAVLPDYSRLSQDDIRTLSREDTPSDRMVRRLKRMGVYGAGGAGTGAVMSKLVTSKVNPLWVAIPAALAAGTGLAKGAAAELMDHMFGDNDDIASALDNVDFDIETHAPPERRRYAKQLKHAAESTGLAVPDIVEQYAADTYGPHIGAGLEMRCMVSERYEGFFDKHANDGPEKFAEALYDLDTELGLVVNPRIPDAFYTTFGKTAISEEDRTLLVADGQPFKLSDAMRLKEYKTVLDRILPAHMTEELYEFPWKFPLMSHPYQMIIARAIFRARGKMKADASEEDKPSKKPAKKPTKKPEKKKTKK